MIRRPPRSTLFPTRRSSDLIAVALAGMASESAFSREKLVAARPGETVVVGQIGRACVGKECRSRGSPYHEKKKEGWIGHERVDAQRGRVGSSGSAPARRRGS